MRETWRPLRTGLRTETAGKKFSLYPLPESLHLLLLIAVANSLLTVLGVTVFDRCLAEFFAQDRIDHAV